MFASFFCSNHTPKTTTDKTKEKQIKTQKGKQGGRQKKGRIDWKRSGGTRKRRKAPKKRGREKGKRPSIKANDFASGSAIVVA